VPFRKRTSWACPPNGHHGDFIHAVAVEIARPHDAHRPLQFNAAQPLAVRRERNDLSRHTAGQHDWHRPIEPCDANLIYRCAEILLPARRPVRGKNIDPAIRTRRHDLVAPIAIEVANSEIEDKPAGRRVPKMFPGNRERAHAIIVGGTDNFFRGWIPVEFRHGQPVDVPAICGNDLDAGHAPFARNMPAMVTESNAPKPALWSSMDGNVSGVVGVNDLTAPK